LDIYLPELEKLAGRLYAPSQIPTNVAEDETLTWLAFCMDGRVGPISIRALNTYWDASSDSTAIPNADTICAPLYSQPDTYPQASETISSP